MATASVQYNFAPLTDIESSQVNKNFQDLVVFLNSLVVHTDASRPFSAHPSGPGTDPVSANQYARKGYVDKSRIVAQQKLTVNGAVLTTDTDTDMLLSNIPVNANYVYAVHFTSRFNLSAAGEWAIEVMLNGVKQGECGYVGEPGNGNIDGTIYWVPSVTASTDDIVIRANEVSGAGNFQLIGAVNTPRWLTVTAIGSL